MEYDFTLKFKLPDSDTAPDELVERLGAAGCDDALVGTGMRGRLALAFTRKAKTAKVAVFSALADVRNVELVEAAPDFVGLSDVAEIAAVSRQNMRKLMVTHVDSFPPPIHDGSASVWHLALVLQWLQERGYTIDRRILEIATTAMQLNVTREAQLVPPLPAKSCEKPLRSRPPSWIAGQAPR